MSSHTKGKLRQEHRKTHGGGYSTEIFDEHGETVATAAWYPVKIETGFKTNREANARRLVTCWNALLPFTTEQIEEGIDLVGLVKERDELVNLFVEWWTNDACDSSYYFNKAMQASPALAKRIQAQYADKEKS